MEMTDRNDNMHYYGSDAALIKKLFEENILWKEFIHPLLPYHKAAVIWAVRNEMCITVEDALARRTRALLLDAKAAVEAAPLTAKLMADEMGKTREWIDGQVDRFTAIAKNYLPGKL